MSEVLISESLNHLDGAITIFFHFYLTKLPTS